MTQEDLDELILPVAETSKQKQMSRRDTIALGIFNGFLSDGGDGFLFQDACLKRSVELADKLIAELDKSRDGK